MTTSSRSALAARPSLSEIAVGIVQEFLQYWLPVAGVLVMVAVAILAHTAWCYTALPDDIYRSTRYRIEQMAPGFHWESSRYGLLSGIRCPNWEAASFRLVGRAQRDEAPPVAILCCTAVAEPTCTLLHEP